jgi:predicted methyltransferase
MILTTTSRSLPLSVSKESETKLVTQSKTKRQLIVDVQAGLDNDRKVSAIAFTEVPNEQVSCTVMIQQSTHHMHARLFHRHATLGFLLLEQTRL